jgi:D-alanine-D-alanine ligase-like ATP-grasp enzyme
MPRVALVFNLIRAALLAEGPIDRSAEYDSEETVASVSEALRSGGHEVIHLEADERIAEKLLDARPDIVFNIAEGLRGESRESHVPAICEMLGFPYSGSGPLTLALCLNKARTKEILSVYGISNPSYQVLNHASDPLSRTLRYPMIVKLLQEGSSMGLTGDSVVQDEPALRRQAAHLLAIYKEPVLVEEFIQGREFTAPVLGNEAPRVLPIVESVFSDPFGIVLFSLDDAIKPLVAKVRSAGEASAPAGSSHRSICPAEIDDTLRRRIEDTALRAYRALGCRDWCRMEMRLDRSGELQVLELNPIAGIDPSYWFARSAAVAGMSYADLINEILGHALQRTIAPAISAASGPVHSASTGRAVPSAARPLPVRYSRSRASGRRRAR